MNHQRCCCLPVRVCDEGRVAKFIYYFCDNFGLRYGTVSIILLPTDLKCQEYYYFLLIVSLQDLAMSADTTQNRQRRPEVGEAQFPKRNGDAASQCSRRRQYNTVQEYTQSLQRWIRDYHSYQAAQNFYAMMPMFMSSPGFVGPAPSAHPFNVGSGFASPRVGMPHTDSRQGDTAPQQGRVYLLPSVWKRLAAELIDFLILFYIKLIVSVGVMRQMGMLESDNIELQGFYRAILTPDDVDLDKLLALSSEIIALEIVNRLCISVVEALCLRQGVGVIGGATPGKRILGMCVVRCDESTDVGHGRVQVSPATDIGFKRALVRSLIKNFTMAFFFPACLTLFLFRHNRSAYDVIAGTIVVQSPDHLERR